MTYDELLIQADLEGLKVKESPSRAVTEEFLITESQYAAILTQP